MTNLLAFNSLSPGGDLNAYVQTVSGFPILTAEEEKALAERFYYENDLEAARKLVLCHLRFVVHLARSYAGYGLSHGDLIQEGNVGLMKAVKRYNPEVGVRLVSFAVHWIKAEMHEFILRNWRIVKVATTKAQRKLFFNLRSNKRKLGWLNQAETEAVAKDLGVSPEVAIIPRLRKHVRVPLVLQLNSPMTNQDLQRSIRAGIVKIHVGSTSEMTFRGALRRSLRSDRIVDPRFYQASVRTALTERASAVLEAISCGDPPHSSA